MNIEELNPQHVWHCFKQLTQIPRPSGHCKEVAKFLVAYGQSLGLETLQDEIGNVLIRKPASAGFEKHPGVILQGHMDMVPQKDNHKCFDFTTDPIEAYIDGEWVTANGTTLGADDGMGVAAAMAILADNKLEHPALEALFTVDEETGMYGAFDIKANWLQGKILLNLDSESEGELYVGCAGGVDPTATFAYVPAKAEEGDIAFKVVIGGLLGGHSGCDIHLQRANAIKLLSRFLKRAITDIEARLASIDGGSLRNSIPRDAEAIICIPEENQQELIDLIGEFNALFAKEYKGTDGNISLTAAQTNMPASLIPEEIQDNLIHALTACPHGVFRMIPEMPQIVETSNNLAIIKTEEGKVTINCLTRSSVESRKKELMSMIESTFAMAGAKVEFAGDYPGWLSDFHSELLSKMHDVYMGLFQKEPSIVTIHAGLECGIIGRNYPDMQMVSFGPTILHPHSPEEKVNIKTVDMFYAFIKEIIKNL